MKFITFSCFIVLQIARKAQQVQLLRKICTLKHKPLNICIHINLYIYIIYNIRCVRCYVYAQWHNQWHQQCLAALWFEWMFAQPNDTTVNPAVDHWSSTETMYSDNNKNGNNSICDVEFATLLNEQVKRCEVYGYVWQ